MQPFEGQVLYTNIEMGDVTTLQSGNGIRWRGKGS